MRGGILFDMDGTLVHSEPVWGDEELKLATELGIDWSPDTSEAWVGMPVSQTGEEFIRRGADITVEAFVQRLSQAVSQRISSDIPWIPGAPALLEQVAAHGIPAAIVTNASQCNAGPIVTNAPAGSLQFAIAVEDVTHGKPNPEPYLHGAEKLGIDPRMSLAFEDSVAGATAARDAGLEVWFVETQTAPPAWAARSVKDLTEVTFAEVSARLDALAAQTS